MSLLFKKKKGGEEGVGGVGGGRNGWSVSKPDSCMMSSESGASPYSSMNFHLICTVYSHVENLQQFLLSDFIPNPMDRPQMADITAGPTTLNEPSLQHCGRRTEKSWYLSTSQTSWLTVLSWLRLLSIALCPKLWASFFFFFACGLGTF